MSLSPPDNVLGVYRGRVVLVLGASGFIGRRLSAVLVSAGAKVTTVVRGGSGPATPRGDGPTRTTQTDLTKEGSAAHLVNTIQPDATFNLAGYGVSPTQREEAAAIRLNTGLPAELAEVCGGQRNSDWPGLSLVHAGSAMEYGVAAGDLVESTPAQPTTVYGRTKLGGTQAIAEAWSTGRLLGVSARLFTVYGPGEMDGRLLPTLLRAARGGKSIALSSGTQRRDFTSVDDVVEGLLRLGALPSTDAPVVNLATGILTPVRAFVERAARVLGIPAERLDFGALPGRPEEMGHDPVNIARLVRWTGWRPAMDIEAGVRVAADDAGLHGQGSA